MPIKSTFSGTSSRAFGFTSSIRPLIVEYLVIAGGGGGGGNTGGGGGAGGYLTASSLTA